MRIPVMVATIVALLGASSCAHRQTGESSGSELAPSPSDYAVEQAGRAGAVTDQDRQFVYQAAVSGLAEVTLGQMAEQKAISPAVRSFARQMVADHTRADHQLQEVAVQQAGLRPPDALDAAHLATRDQLAALTGSGFERAYMQNQVQEQQNAILLFQQEASSGGQPNLQRFAADTAPLLQQHLQMAQRIAAQLEAQPPASSELRR